MKEKILKLLQEIRPDVDFAKETALMDDGVIDSFDIIQIIGSLNDEFDINISVDELLPENFNNVDEIAALVAKLQAEE